ncbi:hypothetical protein C7212DRAFT_363536 [Tuber magnatum]|uniref:Uncharacterized protein n=1 Tax=Tuber magnatum TaxID=42249 RepID=A0A317SQ49_9PEZI|nr:hypothetical protein C7212DRAFT_363536 [Tuber magnatum]
MERNYTAAVRAINADSRKRHRSRPEVVIPCPPPKPDNKGSEDFISLNFESENEDEIDDDDESDGDESDDGDYDDDGDNSKYSFSEGLRTTQTSLLEEEKRDESEGGISEKTRFKRRRKDPSDRKDSTVGRSEVGEEVMKAVAKSEEFVAATRGIGKNAPAVTIDIKSSSSSSPGGAYRHERDEDKDSTTRKAQQQRQQKLNSTAAPSSYLAITATSPLSLPSSTQAHAAGTSTNTTSFLNPKPQSAAKKTTAEILQGGGDLPPKALQKFAKNQKSRERRRVERTYHKAALEQPKKDSIDHPCTSSFDSVPSDVDEAGEEGEEDEEETNESGEEGLEINLAQEEEEGQGGAKEGEEEENYISLSITKAPVFTASRRSIPSPNSSCLFSL